MRPIHAGLTGNDCLVILDEVHLSVPFAETLAQVSALRGSEPLPRRFCTVEMSATPNDERAERFTLDSETDLDGCAELRRRVKTSKWAELVSVPNREAVPVAALKIVKSIAKSFCQGESQIRNMGIVVNRVRTARETYELLAGEDVDAHLITGRMRPLDRIDALDRIDPVVDPDRNWRGDRLVVVVATQAIEIGADFSFDALVTECAAVDSIRQRFGRLDRRGIWSEQTGLPARAWIIGPRSIVGSRKPDPIYGDSVKVTWEECQRRSKERLLDVGPMSLRDFPDSALAPRESAPLLLKTHMDAWVQTRPEPLVQPSVEWFLHGISQNRPADVSVLWRQDRSSEALRFVPPRQAEILQIPITAARSWLGGSSEVDVADVPQSVPADEDRYTAEARSGEWVRWDGFGGGAHGEVRVGDIRPGDVLVVDPGRGGLRGGTWDPSSTDPVEDLGDVAQVECGRKATLRLDPRLPYVVSPPIPVNEAEADDPLAERVAGWLESWGRELVDPPQWLTKTIGKLGSDFEVNTVGVEEENPGSYYILTERHPSTRKPVVEVETMDGSDEAGSFTSTGVTLRRHLEGVGERAGQIAERLGLPPAIVEDIRLAGRLHDLGKVDTRFQLQLVGGDPVELEMRREDPLAKSLPGVRRIRGYPEGMRHEVSSVAMIGSNRDVFGKDRDRDLVLHLVGTHHGWGRPLPPIIEDPEPQLLSYNLGRHILKTGSNLSEGSLALEMADRFWRLVGRYGYHGLAWLEAVLRLADHQQSAEEARQT